MLRVQVAEVQRNALRSIGMDFNILKGGTNVRQSTGGRAITHGRGEQSRRCEWVSRANKSPDDARRVGDIRLRALRRVVLGETREVDVLTPGPEPRHVLQGKARVSMSVPACAACGAERRSKLCFKTTGRRPCCLSGARFHLDSMFLFCSNRHGQSN